MHCELVVPGLLALPAGARLPALELLLARGRRRTDEALTLERWLANAFGLDEDKPVPAGALTNVLRQQEGIGNSLEEAIVVRADPVHLRVMRDHVAVMPSEALDLSLAEAAAFAEAVNAHFAGALTLHVHDPRRWTAALAGKSAVAAAEGPALLSADGEAAANRGGDAQLTEIQMLLHAHPANEAREARGEPTVNSLWFWGAGPLPRAESRWTTVLADDPLALGLARAAGTRHLALPASADEWLARAPEEGRHLIILNGLRAPALLSDNETFVEGIGEIERNWFRPLLAALRKGRVGMVTVHVPDAEEALACETTRGDLRRFWRRVRALEAYA